MKNTMWRSVCFTFHVSCFMMIVAFSAHAAWTGPTQAPAGGNTAEPLHVGSATQTKAGSIILQGNLTAPGLCLPGATAGTNVCKTSWSEVAGTTPTLLQVLQAGANASATTLQVSLGGDLAFASGKSILVNKAITGETKLFTGSWNSTTRAWDPLTFSVLGANSKLSIGTSVASTYTLEAESPMYALRVGNANSWLKVNTGGNSRLSLGDGAAHEAGYIAGGNSSTVGQNTISIASCDDVGNCPGPITLQSNGNVGIGTASPGARLEVAGQIKITGGSPGLNKVLTSDANGLASWAAPSGVTSGSFVNLQAGTAPGVPQTGNLNVSGTVTAGSFSGSGASLTGLNATQLTSGTIPSSAFGNRTVLLSALGQNGCGVDNVVKWAGSSGFVCGVDQTGTATSGLTSVTTTAPLAGAGTAASPLALSNSGCSGGWVLKRNAANNAWVCSADAGIIQVTADGRYAQLQGFPGTTQSGSININGNITAGSFTGQGTSLTSLNASNLSSGNIPFTRLPSGCGANQILKWNGTTWACAADDNTGTSGGLTQATADGRYVNVDGDTMTGNLTLSNSDVYMSSTKAIRVDGAGLTYLNVGNWGVGATGAQLSLMGGASAFTTPKICFSANGTTTSCMTSVPASGGLTQATADTLYVKKVGDTMTGQLTVSSVGKIQLDSPAPELVFYKRPWSGQVGRIYGQADGNAWTDARLTLQSVNSSGGYIDTLSLKNGNVGIGVTTPGAKLEVSGQIKITGGSPGLNKVLTSDVAGLASWAAPTGGTSSSSVNLQVTTPGTAQTGNMNISGTVKAGTILGTNATITNLNGTDANLTNLNTGFLSFNGGGALDSTKVTSLTSGADSTQHFHASDRNLANATGSLAYARITACTTAGQILKYTTTGWACAADADTDTNTTYNVASGGGLALSSTNFGLKACAANKILKRNPGNTDWDCVDDATGGTGTVTVTAGDGLTGGGTGSNLTLNVGAGTGIQVTADTVALSSTYQTGSAYDTRFVQKAGDTMTGNLTLSNVDLYMSSGKAIRVDAASDTTLKIGNWNAASGTTPTRKANLELPKGDLTLVSGDLYVNGSADGNKVCRKDGTNCLATTTSVKFPTGTIDPVTCSAANAGLAYFNTTDSAIKICNGTAWIIPVASFGQ